MQSMRAPPSDEPRCYFALLDSEWRFRYLDPDFRASLGEQAQHVLYTSVLRWMHPEELPAAHADAENFARSRTLFGTVTSCRFYRLSAMRKALGAPYVGHNPLEDMTALDDTWTQTRIVASWIGEGSCLLFFHAIQDRDVHADNDEQHLSTWSNWCGPSEWDPTEFFLNDDERNLLSQVMTDSDREARQNAGHRQGSNPQDLEAPRYVFQILTSTDARLLLSQPPPRVISGPSSPPTLDYDAMEYARLAKEVWEKPRERNSEANTNCTRRFRSKHPIMKDGVLTTTESVIIRYNALCFACFQTQGSFSSNSKTDPSRVDTSSPAQYANVPQLTLEDHLRRSSSTTGVSPRSSLPHSILRKRRRSRSEAPTQGHRPIPLPLTTSAYHPYPQASSQGTWAYDGEDIGDGLSPTVATGAALLGSLGNPRGPPSHSLQAQPHTPSSSSTGSATSYIYPPQIPATGNEHDYDPSMAQSSPVESFHNGGPHPQQHHHNYAPHPTQSPVQGTNSNVASAYTHVPQPPAQMQAPPAQHPSHPGHAFPPYAPGSYPYFPNAPAPALPPGYERRTVSEPQAPVVHSASHSSSNSREDSQEPGRSFVSASSSHVSSQQELAQISGDGPDSPSADLSGSTSSTAASRRQRRQAREAEAGRTCASCGTANSPEWRKGPTGIKSLCNACGLRYARSVARDARKEAEAEALSQGKPPPQFASNKKKKTSKSLSSSSSSVAALEQSHSAGANADPHMPQVRHSQTFSPRPALHHTNSTESLRRPVSYSPEESLRAAPHYVQSMPPMYHQQPPHGAPLIPQQQMQWRAPLQQPAEHSRPVESAGTWR